MLRPFSYDEAFSRNIGWVTIREQEMLRHKRVAIAGMGGVGGIHLLTLARLGIGAFNIADFDVFDLVNFNRQAGAAVSTLGQPKVQVMAGLAKDINPELDVKVFPEGINEDNLSEFLTGVDLYVDGLDFFVFSARQATFAACAKAGIPAITAAPLGMGAALLNFLPGKMTFEEYFQLGDLPEEDKALRFMLGLSPALLQMGYLVDTSRVDSALQSRAVHHHGVPVVCWRRARGAEDTARARKRPSRPARRPLRRLPQQTCSHLASGRQQQPAATPGIGGCQASTEHTVRSSP